MGGIGSGLSLLGRGRRLFLGRQWRERARRPLLALLTGSGLALPGGDVGQAVRQVARREVESAESWKYQFKVVIVKISKRGGLCVWLGCGERRGPKPGRLEPVWSRELARREWVQGEVCEAGAGRGLSSWWSWGLPRWSGCHVRCQGRGFGPGSGN